MSNGMLASLSCMCCAMPCVQDMHNPVCLRVCHSIICPHDLEIFMTGAQRFELCTTEAVLNEFHRFDRSPLGYITSFRRHCPCPPYPRHRLPIVPSTLRESAISVLPAGLIHTAALTLPRSVQKAELRVEERVAAQYNSQKRRDSCASALDLGQHGSYRGYPARRTSPARDCRR